MRAEVSKPKLYHYFQSKLGLFETLLNEQSAGLLTDLEGATAYAGDVTLSITRIVRLYFAFCERNPDFYRLMLATTFAPPSNEVHQSVSCLHMRQFALIEQLFLDAVPDHGNMRGRHQQYAVSLRGMIDTYAGLSLQGHIHLGRDDMVYRVVHQFMHGIFS